MFGACQPEKQALLTSLFPLFRAAASVKKKDYTVEIDQNCDVAAAWSQIMLVRGSAVRGGEQQSMEEPEGLFGWSLAGSDPSLRRPKLDA